MDLTNYSLLFWLFLYQIENKRGLKDRIFIDLGLIGFSLVYCYTPGWIEMI